METERDKFFNCRKWFLFTLSLLGLIGSVILVGLFSYVLIGVQVSDEDMKKLKESDSFRGSESTNNPFSNSNNDISLNTKEDLNIVIKTTAIYMIIYGSLSGLFELFGLLGTCKEHYSLTLTYTILIGLRCGYCLVRAVYSPIQWLSFIFNGIVFALAITFTRDLRRLQNQSLGAVYMSGQPPAYDPSGKASISIGQQSAVWQKV